MLISISVTKENENKLIEKFGEIPKWSRVLELLLNSSNDMSLIVDMLERLDSRLDKMWEWIKQQGTQKSSSSSSDTVIVPSKWWLQKKRTIKELLDERWIIYTDRFISWYMVYVNQDTWKLNKAYYAIANDYEICKNEYEKVGYVYDKSWQKWEMSWEEVIRDKGWELFDEMYDSLQEFK